jgi:hypothetical protein
MALTSYVKTNPKVKRELWRFALQLSFLGTEKFLRVLRSGTLKNFSGLYDAAKRFRF